jgi:hypothetical protein
MAPLTCPLYLSTPSHRYKACNDERACNGEMACNSERACNGERACPLYHSTPSRRYTFCKVHIFVRNIYIYTILGANIERCILCLLTYFPFLLQKIWSKSRSQKICYLPSLFALFCRIIISRFFYACSSDIDRSRSIVWVCSSSLPVRATPSAWHKGVAIIWVTVMFYYVRF